MLAVVSDWLIRIPGTNVHIHVFQLTAFACVSFLPLMIVIGIVVLIYGFLSKRREG